MVCSQHLSGTRPSLCCVQYVRVSSGEMVVVRPINDRGSNENIAADHGQLISGPQCPAQYGDSVLLGVGFLKLSDFWILLLNATVRCFNPCTRCRKHTLHSCLGKTAGTGNAGGGVTFKAPS